MAIVQTIRTWGEMIKFSHSVFALPFALTAAFLAGRRLPERHPSLGQLGLIVVCMVAARSFAMTFNRIADAALDARNPRTAQRPLPAGRITIAQAWLFLLVAAAVFITGCIGFERFCANPWPLRLCGPTLIVLAVYSYAKRFTALSHFVLGAVIALAPTAAWIAIHPASLGRTALLLTGAVCLWIAGFDLIYACQDVEADRRDGLFSIPARLGIRWALILSRLCHVLTIALLFAVGRVENLGWLYWTGLSVTAVLLAAEQSVVRPNDLSRVNLAFFTLNGVVSLVFGATAIADVLLFR